MKPGTRCHGHAITGRPCRLPVIQPGPDFAHANATSISVRAPLPSVRSRVAYEKAHQRLLLPMPKARARPVTHTDSFLRLKRRRNAHDRPANGAGRVFAKVNRFVVKNKYHRDNVSSRQKLPLLLGNKGDTISAQKLCRCSMLFPRFHPTPNSCWYASQK